MNITIKVSKNGEVLTSMRSHKIRRILNFVRKINFRDREINVSLHVYYGKDLDNFGELISFKNSGIYKFEPWDDKADALEIKFWNAFKAFTEKGEPHE